MWSLLTCVLLLVSMLIVPSTASAAETPQFLVTPTALDFGPVQVGVESPEQVVTVTNIGSSPVTVSMAGGAPWNTAFQGYQDFQGDTLAPGESGHLTYKFTPTAVGSVSTTSEFTLNGQPFTVSLVGMGVSIETGVAVQACKLEDLDANPSTAADRVPVSGWEVKLYKDGNLLDTALTGANGCYTWSNLDPGHAYSVSETVPANWYAWTPPTVVLDPIPSGGTGTATFVNSKKVAVKACKLEDVDGNPATAADRAPVEGWEVKLYKDGNLLHTALTGTDGCYTWSNLDPSHEYSVSETVPANWYAWTPTTVALNPIASGGTGTVTFVNSELASLGDRVWWDYDHDGIQDDGELEPGIEGIRVELWQCDGTAAFDSTLTDEDGYYLFDDLMPGAYYVKFILPEGHMFTQQDAGSADGLDSDANPTTGATICIILDSGEDDMTWDAGIYLKWRTGDSATGSGTRITVKKSSTWFMYNTVNLASAEAGDTQTFAIQGGNPLDGANVIGTLTVTKTTLTTYTVTYDLMTTVERNGSLWTIIDRDDTHLSISDSVNFKAIPGRDDNQDFGVAFTQDGVFYMFAHLVVCYE
jgi:hypothetical protein